MISPSIWAALLAVAVLVVRSGCGGRSQMEKRGQGSLSRSEVSKAIQKRMGQIRRCYERQLMRTKKRMSGTLKLEWVVKRNGRVRWAKVTLDILGSAKVAGCVVKQIKRAEFPSPKGGEATIDFPFVFSSR